MSTQTYDKEIKALRDDFEALKSDISELTTAVRADVKATAKAKSQQAVDAGAAGVNALQATIEDRPFATTLTAFSIGLIIGKALNR
ncbi:MAG: hypothetical protein RIC29_08440 [Rhodospirillaceae bacterium]